MSTEQQVGTPAPATASARPALPTEHPGRRVELASLTGLRGVSALAIFVFHFTTFQMVKTPEGLSFASLDRPRILDLSGNYAVSIFFVLSGFVLVWSTSPRSSIANYFAKRVGKLYPIYFVTTLVAIAAVTLLGLPLSWGNIISHALLLQSWVPQQEVYLGINPVTWSLSTEFFFYLLFPLALVALRAMTNRGIVLTYAVAVVLSFAAPFWVAAQFSTADSTPGEIYFDTSRYGGELVYWFTMAFPPYRFLEFLAGMCLGVLFARGAAPRIPLRWAWGLVAVGYALGTVGPFPLQRAAAGIVPLTVLVLALAQSDLAGRRNPLKHRWWTTLGRLSYGMYAVQLLIFLPTGPLVRSWLVDAGVPAALVSSGWGQVALMTAYFLVVVAVAHPLYRWVEVPAYDRARRLFGDRPPSALFARREPRQVS